MTHLEQITLLRDALEIIATFDITDSDVSQDMQYMANAALAATAAPALTIESMEAALVEALTNGTGMVKIMHVPNDEFTAAPAEQPTLSECRHCGFFVDAKHGPASSKWHPLAAPNAQQQDAKDAERYRWLRNVGDDSFVSFTRRIYKPEQADNYIDAAIAAAPKDET